MNLNYAPKAYIKENKKSVNFLYLISWRKWYITLILQVLYIVVQWFSDKEVLIFLWCGILITTVKSVLSDLIWLLISKFRSIKSKDFFNKESRIVVQIFSLLNWFCRVVYIYIFPGHSGGCCILLLISRSRANKNIEFLPN